MTNDDKLVEKLVSSETLYIGSSYSFTLDKVILPNGRTRVREHLHHPGGVAIMAIDEENRCALVRQYRNPIQQVLLEIPAGKLDKIPDETPEHAAHRELREETGYTAEVMLPLGVVYPSPGIVDEVLHLFFAKGLKISAQELDDDEFIHVEWLSLEELRRQIAEEQFNDNKTICALMRAELKGYV